MSNLKADLLSMVDRLDKAHSLPSVAQLFTPQMTGSQCSTSKFAKFGVLVLADGSCGFFYGLLNNTLANINKVMIDDLHGASAVSVAHWYADESNPALHSVGMAAINAISDHIFRHSQFVKLRSNKRSRWQKKPKHLGMVGYFPPLVRTFRESGQKLTIIEQNPDFIEKTANLEVTLDPRRLVACDEVICTASTLLNGSLETILAACNKQSRISLIGPTAGCLPDPLFARRIASVGASRVMNLQLLLERMKKSEPWGDAVEKYTIDREDYPGYEALLT